MKKLSRKLAAGFLALAMVLTTALPYLPSIDVFAASKTMAHIVSGAENGNGHFGSATPEAFALSPDATFTNEDFSSTLKTWQCTVRYACKGCPEIQGRQ